MRGVRVHIVAGVALVSVLTAACGGDSSGSTGGGVDDGGIYDRAPETSAATGATAATGSTGVTGAEADVSVSLNNYLFDPDPVEVRSGDVVAVRNGNTRTPHTFTVVGQDVDLELAPLATGTVTIDLEPGTYDLICRFHEQLGMTATLAVT